MIKQIETKFPITLKNKKPLVFFDLETTGLDVTKAQIVQFSGIRVEPYGERTFHTKFDSYDVLIKPSIPIEPEATAVHGVTEEMVKDCRSFKELAPVINNFLDGADLGGYNITGFDLAVFMEEMLRAGIEFDILDRIILDTCNSFHKLNPRTLAACYKQYTGITLENAHNALADTLATLEATQRMEADVEAVLEVKGIEDWANKVYNRSELVDFAGKFKRREDGAIVFNFSKHKGKPVSEEPGMLDWMLSGKFDLTEDTRRWTRLLKLDPTGADGRKNKKEEPVDDEHAPPL